MLGVAGAVHTLICKVFDCILEATSMMLVCQASKNDVRATAAAVVPARRSTVHPELHVSHCMNPAVPSPRHV